MWENTTIQGRREREQYLQERRRRESKELQLYFTLLHFTFHLLFIYFSCTFAFTSLILLVVLFLCVLTVDFFVTSVTLVTFDFCDLLTL